MEEMLQEAYEGRSITSEMPVRLAAEEEGAPSFNVKTDVFEGHFDALLDMIEQKSVDICDIRLSDVTSQYLEFLSLSQALDLPQASEFMYIAAYLIELKSKALLPVEEEEAEEEEVRTSLVDHIMQYRIFKKIASALRERKELFSKVYHRFKLEPGRDGPGHYVLRDVSVSDLAGAFRKVWAEVKERTDGIEIVDEMITIEEKISEIKEQLAASPQGIGFESMFRVKTRLHVIVTFLAVLELIRLKQIAIKQAELFGSIYILPSA